MSKLKAAIEALEAEAKASGLHVQVVIHPEETPVHNAAAGVYVTAHSTCGESFAGHGRTAHEAVGSLLAKAGIARNAAGTVIAGFGFTAGG